MRHKIPRFVERTEYACPIASVIDRAERGSVCVRTVSANSGGGFVGEKEQKKNDDRDESLDREELFISPAEGTTVKLTGV